MYTCRNQRKGRRKKELLEGVRQKLKRRQPPKKMERRNRQRRERRNQTTWNLGNHHVGGR